VTQAIIDAVVTVALIAAYVTMSVTGHDGTAILAVLVGYLGRAGTAAIAARNGD
jgi:hypothetical protein